MEVTIITYLIVCPLVFLAGLVDSIAGGGGLISLPAYIIAGVPVHTALGTNKLSASIGTSISTYRYVSKGFIYKKIVKYTIIFSVLGSFAGAKLALFISEDILSIIIIFVLPIIAFYILKNKDFGYTTTIKEKKESVIIVMASIAAFLIGGYDGLYGPGTGTFLIIIFTTWIGLDVKTSSGNAKVINLTSNIAALIIFLINGKVLWGLGLIASIFSIAGNYVGSGMVIKKGNKTVKPIIIIVLLLLFFKLILE